MLVIFLAKSVRVKGKCPTQGRVVSCNTLTFVGRNAKLLSLMLLGFIVLLSVHGYSQVAQRNIVHQVMPKYPVLLKSKGIGGIVRLVAVVNPSGSVAKIETLGGSFRLLSPEPFWLVQDHQAYSGLGADIVMESITPTIAQARLRCINNFRPHPRLTARMMHLQRRRHHPTRHPLACEVKLDRKAK